MARLGLVGTGEMGWRIGRLLVAAGHTVRAYDRRGEALIKAEAVGLEPARSPADAADQADAVLTCLTDGAALKDAVCGPDGILERIPAGSTIIDLTSAEPWIGTDVAARAAKAAVEFLDAPMSGGVAAADGGRIEFVIGGKPEVLGRWKELLGVLGKTCAHVGPTGAGHTMKAINTLAMAGSFLASAEVLATGQQVGIAPDVLLNVLNESSGGSYVTRIDYPRYVLSGSYCSGLAFDTMRKDMSTGIKLARRHGVQLFVGHRSHQLYEAAANLGYGGTDNTRIANMIFTPDAGGATKLEAPEAAFPAALEKVAFIGLGAMGSRMVRRLLAKGVVPVVYDVDPAAVAKAVEDGARAAASPAAASAQSNIVLLSLPNATVIEQVVHGDEGILAGLRLSGRDTLVIDTSSSKAATTRRARESLREIGCDMLDAPVSRGQPAAERGDLSIMIGGTPDALVRGQRILELLGTDLIPVAGPGSGHDAKALNNLLNATNVVIGGEAILLGMKAGLNPGVVVDTLNAGSGASEVLAKRYPQHVLTGSFRSNFRLDLMHKDAAYGLELAGQAQVPALLTGTAVQLYAAAIRRLGHGADNTEFFKVLCEWNGMTWALSQRCEQRETT